MIHMSKQMHISTIIGQEWDSLIELIMVNHAYWSIESCSQDDQGWQRDEEASDMSFDIILLNEFTGMSFGPTVLHCGTGSDISTDTRPLMHLCCHTLWHISYERNYLSQRFQHIFKFTVWIDIFLVAAYCVQEFCRHKYWHVLVIYLVTQLTASYWFLFNWPWITHRSIKDWFDPGHYLEHYQEQHEPLC